MERGSTPDGVPGWPLICRRTIAEVIGARTNPCWPCPVATDSPRSWVRPTTGSPSATHGRSPAQVSMTARDDRPEKTLSPALIIAPTRPWSTELSDPVSSITPASRRRSGYGVATIISSLIPIGNSGSVEDFARSTTYPFPLISGRCKPLGLSKRFDGSAAATTVCSALRSRYSVLTPMVTLLRRIRSSAGSLKWNSTPSSAARSDTARTYLYPSQCASS
jgi:hypothetical protein